MTVLQKARAVPGTGTGSGSGKPLRGRRRFFRGAGRPGFLSYGILLAFLIGSAYPLWWSLIIGSRSNEALGLDWPPLWPGGNFWTNAAAVFDTVPFWKALANSIIISGTITVSVVIFSTLAGYAFAKLRFRGRGLLMVAVIATMAIPTSWESFPCSW